MLSFVCTNRMIAGERFEKCVSPTRGGIEDRIIEGAHTVARDFPRPIDAAGEMKETRLSRDEQTVLATTSLIARYGEEKCPLRGDQAITPRRPEDGGPSLRTSFNVIQENLVRGGFRPGVRPPMARSGAVVPGRSARSTGMSD